VPYLEYIIKTPNTNFIEKLSEESRLITKADNFLSNVLETFNESINSDWFLKDIDTLQGNIREGLSLGKETLEQLYFRKKAYAALKQVIDSEENINRLFNHESLARIFKSLNIDFPSEKGFIKSRRINHNIKKLLKELDKTALKELIQRKVTEIDKVISDIHTERDIRKQKDLSDLGRDYEYTPLLGQTLNGNNAPYWRNAGPPVNNDQRPEKTPSRTTTSESPTGDNEIDTSKILDMAMKTAHTALRL